MREALFCADDGMVASTNPGWIQTAFDMLAGIFDEVVLQKNITKTVGMVFHPCRAAEVRAEKAYTQSMTGEGRSHKESQRERVHLPEGRKDLARGSLAVHQQTQHGAAKGGSGKEVDKEGGVDQPTTLRMAFLAKVGPRPYPV